MHLGGLRRFQKGNGKRETDETSDHGRDIRKRKRGERAGHLKNDSGGGGLRLEARVGWGEKEPNTRREPPRNTKKVR